MFELVAVPAGILLVVLLAGYLAWLDRGHQAVTGSSPRPLEDWPRVDVIVAVHNEAEWMEAKLQNLSELRYPAGGLRIWIVDGASSDATVKIAAGWIRNDARFELLRLSVANKIAQLNAAIERSAGKWVMVTDADARLGPDTLTTLVAVGEADAEVVAVGATVEPARAHALERLHWQITNRLRQQESRRGCASIVTGPCYLFRRALLPAFPTDVVADDIHVALAGAASGRRVSFVAETVTELRAPTGLADLFQHKVRKADAYLREIFRFLPRVGAMASPAREVFLWRAAHLLVAPTLSAMTLIGLAGWLSTGVLGFSQLPAAAAGVVLTGGAWMHRRYMSMFLLELALGTFLTGVLLTALVAYPFSQQTARYPKVASAVKPRS